MSKPAVKQKKEKEFEVEQIRAIRWNSATQETHCLVKWKLFDDSHTAWEPMDHCSNAKERMKEAAAHHGKPKPKWSFEYYMAEPKDGKDIGWFPYDVPAAECMSNYFQKYCMDAAQMTGQIECVVSGKYQYLIDFDAWTQTNVRVAPHTKRPIRCVPVSCD